MSINSIAAEPLISVYGIGTQSCGKFIQTTKNDRPDIAYQKGAGFVLTEATMFMQWARGYVSAINHIKSRDGDQSASTVIDHDAMLTWLENYCAREPEKTWYQAVNAFVTR